jgi:IS5 family transposase
VDRGEAGTKRNLLVDGEGTPLGLTLSPANRHDAVELGAVLDAAPPVRGRPGRPRRRPGKLHGDKGYDHRRCGDPCRRRGIAPRIARRGVSRATASAGTAGGSSGPSGLS